MELAELSDLLDRFTDEQFVDLQILNCTPWIFLGDNRTYLGWRIGLAEEVRLEPHCFFLVGSAATGFSLNPAKPGRNFRTLTAQTSDKSDLDLAIVSEPAFLEAWNVVVSHERNRILALEYQTREKLKRDVYWGHLPHHLIPHNTDPARQMRTVIAACGRNVLLRGYSTSARLYRRLEDLRAYQINSVRNLRVAVKEKKEAV